MTGLEALRARHLEDAQAHADQMIRGARALSAEIIAQAQADAAALIERAEREGDASAEHDTGRDWVAARRRARGIKLAAQRRALQELRGAATAEAESNERCQALLQSVADSARRRLGPGTEVNVSSHGVSATRKHRHVRWTLEAAIEEALGRLGPELEELWQ